MASVAKPESANIDPLAGIRVVDADTHYSEPYDLWTSRAPAEFRDRVPRVKHTDDGILWVIDDDTSLGVSCAASAIHRTGRKSVGTEFFGWTNEEVASGSYDVADRLRAMDEMGVYAQIVYPNVLGFGGQKSFMVDAGLRQLSIEIFNDAMAEMQADSENRLYPMALLPWWDVTCAVAEAERCASLGLRGININPDPQNHGLPDLSDEYWYPLWEACTSLEMPVNFHIGASDESMSWFGQGCWPSHDENAQLAYGSTMLFIGNQRVLTNILISRFLERFPTLQIVSVESGISWVPFVLEAVDYQMREAGLEMKDSPWEIFDRQISACFWFEERNLVEDIRRLGAGNVLFETDYPHPTCLYPDALDNLRPTIERLTEEERRLVFGGNAARIYRLDI